MRTFAGEGEDLFGEREYIHSMSTKYVQIVPKFLRDGQYYEKDTGLCWFECNRKAFINDKKSFKYSLSLERHNPLTDKQVSALKITLGIKGITKSNLYKLYWLDKTWKSLRRTRREAMKY